MLNNFMYETHTQFLSYQSVFITRVENSLDPLSEMALSEVSWPGSMRAFKKA